MGLAVVRCSSCGARFEQRTSWIDHLRPHALDRVMFTCPRCGTTAMDQIEETRP